MVIDINGYYAKEGPWIKKGDERLFIEFTKGKKVWYWEKSKWIYISKKMKNDFEKWYNEYDPILVKLLKFEE